MAQSVVAVIPTTTPDNDEAGIIQACDSADHGPVVGDGGFADLLFEARVIVEPADEAANFAIRS
jgi:hypothetical protein